VNIPPALRDWLAADHETAPDENASAREDDPIAERLATLTRPLHPRRAALDGAVVMHHPSGRAFAAASGDRILVRTSLARATLAAEPIERLPGWVALDPFPDDVAFERGTNVLRDLLARAFEEAARRS
jgi:hypothetical protein